MNRNFKTWFRFFLNRNRILENWFRFRFAEILIFTGIAAGIKILPEFQPESKFLPKFRPESNFLQNSGRNLYFYQNSGQNKKFSLKKQSEYEIIPDI